MGLLVGKIELPIARGLGLSTNGDMRLLDRLRPIAALREGRPA
jgi:hypothetical protein